MELEGIEDRRIFERFEVGLPVRFLNSGNATEGNAKTLNVSAKGVGLVTGESLVPSAPVELWLEMPDKKEPLYSRGVVVWSERTHENNFKIGVNLEKAELMGFSRLLRNRKRSWPS